MIRPSFANEVTDGRTDGRTDGQTRDGRTDGQTRAYDINRRTDGQTDGRTDRRGRTTLTDGRTDRRTDGRTDAGNVNARVFTNQMWTDGGQRPILKPHLSNQAKNVTSTSRKTAPPPWRPYIYKTNLFTKFHDDWENYVTSRVHVIQLTRIIFELNSCIKQTNVLTKFHENWAKNVTSRTIFNLLRDINKTNVFTKFQDDWAKIVTSRVFKRKTAPSTGGHVFQRTGTTFEINQHIIKANILTNFRLDRDIIGSNLLTKFHEDRTINVASRVFTNKCGRTDDRPTDRRRTKTGHKSSPEQS
ncbi:hypothetical protein DPMN_010128, partial [Dreissena polymorpha]